MDNNRHYLYGVTLISTKSRWNTYHLLSKWKINNKAIELYKTKNIIQVIPSHRSILATDDIWPQNYTVFVLTKAHNSLSVAMINDPLIHNLLE